MATQKVRVKMGFGGLSDTDAVSVSGNVAVSLPTAFDLKTLVPPIDPAGLKLAHDELVAAVEAADQGGPKQTADKNKKRKVVDGMLEKLAHFVQINCDNDLKTVLSTGFSVIAQSRGQTALGVPNIISVDNGKSGELIIKSRSIRNAKSYEVRRATMTNGAAGPWELIGSFPKPRITISGLTPAVTYAFSVRAVGGSTEHSGWSDPVAHMCM